MFIYEIGGEIIRGIAEHASSLSWKGDNQQSSQNALVYFTNRYAVPEAVEIKLKGSINIDKDVDPLNKLHRIIKMGGLPYIDIIGYLPSTMAHEAYCDTDVENNQIYYFHTYGMITKVDREYTLDLETDNQFQIMSLDLELTINPYWTPLNRYLWFPYYGADVPDVFELSQRFTEVGEETWLETYYDIPVIEKRNADTNKPIYHTPMGLVDWHFDAPFVFYKNQSYDPNMLYDPIYWSDWCRYNEQGIGYGFDVFSGTNASYACGNAFSGDIKYLHAFKQPTPANDIYLDVTTEVSPMEIKTYRSRLNCLALHSILQQPEFGSTGLTANHIIFVGNDELTTSFVMNSAMQIVTSSITGQVLVPEWEYETRMPCELFGSRNSVLINEGDMKVLEYAVLLLNRVL